MVRQNELALSSFYVYYEYQAKKLRESSPSPIPTMSMA
jgi:hypothetical protein